MGTVIGATELNSLTKEIWSSMANMNLETFDEIITPDKENGYVVASVQIVGSWKGAVRLDMDLSLARTTAANLLAVDVSEVSQDDIRDSAGELANMTGGSVKGLISASCNLSLPSVAIGSNYEFTIKNGKVVLESGFATESGKLLVTIIERQD
jgi:chemotaxis protein CheX